MTNTSDKALGILLKKYEDGKQKNARWSQRAFAMRLGVSPGAMSEIFHQKRNLSLKLRRKLAPKLGLSPREEAEFLTMSLSSESLKEHLEYRTLDEDAFRLISDWWHFAILNLVKTKGFKPSAAWIVSRIGIPRKTATEAWERLFRLGHLQWKGSKVIRCYPRLQTTDEVLNQSIRHAHLSDLKLIENSLEQVPLELRDHTSTTLVLNKKDLKKAKELIRLFQDKVGQEIHTESGEEVYRLSVSLFPLSKVHEGKEE